MEGKQLSVNNSESDLSWAEEEEGRGRGEGKGHSRKDMNITLRYSFVASCHSLFIVLGAGPAKDLTTARMTPARANVATVHLKYHQVTPGGGSARGPCGPNAMK